jgi:hypothetical protein
MVGLHRPCKVAHEIMEVQSRRRDVSGGAVHYYFSAVHYNFARIYQTLGVTPAKAAA